MKGRDLLFLVFSVLLILLELGITAPSSSYAAGYPDHVVSLVIPNVAGAQTDITGRILAGELEKLINGKIIVNNKPGAATVLATDFVVRAKKGWIHPPLCRGVIDGLCACGQSGGCPL